MSEADRGISLSSRSVQSDVCHPNDQNDKNKRGSYVVNADPEYENAKTPDRQMSQMSGDYDYPDPYPQNQRESYYDNPGLQKVFIQKNDSFLKILSKIHEKKNNGIQTVVTMRVESPALVPLLPPWLLQLSSLSPVRLITTIIIHSKYFPDSDWLKAHA